jgi:hypothetical protein
MSLFTRLAGGLGDLFGKNRVEQELDDELREYLEAAAEQYMTDGMSRDDAIRAARTDGSVEAVKDCVRDVSWSTIGNMRAVPGQHNARSQPLDNASPLTTAHCGWRYNPRAHTDASDNWDSPRRL